MTVAPPTDVRHCRFDVMGSQAEIIIAAHSPARLMTAAVDRLRQLERRWSRFLPTSDVGRMNSRSGRRVVVTADTLLLVEFACRAHRATGGRYDPTMLSAVIASGYDRDFATVLATNAIDTIDPGSPTGTGHGTVPYARPNACGSIMVDEQARTVLLPAGTGFDPGGIGKGLAADLVSAELAAAGVAHGCVNVGGDLRVWGPGPHNGRWRIGVDDRTVEVTDVGVATSSTLRRVWNVDGEPRHHLIDPSTAAPSRSETATASVIAPTAWQAEVFALAAIMVEPAQARADLERWGVAGVVFDTRHRRYNTSALGATS